MNLFRRTPPAPNTPPAPTTSAKPHETARRIARHTLRVLTYGLLTGAATTAGKTAMDIVITLIHHH